MSDIKPFRSGGDALSEQTGKADTIEKLAQNLFEKNLEAPLSVHYLASECTGGREGPCTIMADSNEIDELKALHLCCNCVREAYLVEEMVNRGKRRKCSYCGKTQKGYSIGELAERIDEVFQEHFIRTSTSPMIGST